ncbi:MAG: hypothetical protein FJ291_33050 [Planctomycetes bacterium]|nr:hypothetical protein [Planctomycetota bacterium]
MGNETKNPRAAEEQALRTVAAPAGRPRGTEILLIEASIDPKFRELLLKERAEAAKSIGVKLSAVEAALLNDVPEEHLRKVIAQAAASKKLRSETRRKAAKVALAALGAGAFACGYQQYAKYLDHLQEKRIRRALNSMRIPGAYCVVGMLSYPVTQDDGSRVPEPAPDDRGLPGRWERESKELNDGKE